MCTLCIEMIPLSVSVSDCVCEFVCVCVCVCVCVSVCVIVCESVYDKLCGTESDFLLLVELIERGEKIGCAVYQGEGILR